MKLIVLKNNVPINEIKVEIPDLGERHEIYVGRADDCHVLIDDPLISRHHFVIKNEGPDWFCEKLTQLGVVLVNGNIAPKLKLNAGDEIKCGAYSIIVASLPTTTLSPATTDFSSVQVLQAAAASVADPLPVLKSEEELERTELLNDENPEGRMTEKISEGGEEYSGDDPGDGQDGDTFGGGDSFGGEQVESESSGFTEGSTDASNFSAAEGEGGEMTTTGEEGTDSDEGTRVFRAFVNYQLVLFGENVPYDRYQIDTDEVFIGRDSKKCQIVLDDPEVSSIHAVLRKKGNDVILEDMNSSNGTILNGERINKAHVNAGDDFVIGSTTFTLEVKSDLLDVESDRLMPVEAGQVIETEEVIEEEVAADQADDFNFNTEAPQEKSPLKRMWKDPKQRKKLIIGAVILAVVMLLGDEEPTDAPGDKKEAKTAEAKPEDKDKELKKAKPQLGPEQLNRIQVSYELGVSFFEQAKYFEADKEFQTVISIDPDYKKVQSYLEQTRVAMKRLEEIETQKRAEAERLEKKKKIEELLVKAREATKERRVAVAEQFFGQITELDPENIEVGQLKLDLDAWQKEEERKALEEAAKVAARKKMVDSLAPGKTHYLKKEWYKAILRLEEFLLLKGMDEDLVKEGSDMLADAKNQLASELGPLLGKARSLKEGQDFKNAYESYLEILKIEPTNAEALNEVDDIKSQLESRSRRIYREAIIAESLSLFSDAKEKFQEVQQISPTDSEYYRKATDKLKNYME